MSTVEAPTTIEPLWLTDVRLRAQRRVLWCRELWARMGYVGEESLAIRHSDVDAALARTDELRAAELVFYASDEDASRITAALSLVADSLSWLVVAAVFVFVASRGAGVPRINDYTTDVADPPVFTHAATLPANAGRDLGYPPAFVAAQRQCCADLAPVKLAISPSDAFVRARRVAELMPSWTVTSADPQARTIEAVSESALFHFKDDVVIRVRPDDGGSRIDLRSKSRDGKGDFGVNAARIRAFVAALGAAK